MMQSVVFRCVLAAALLQAAPGCRRKPRRFLRNFRAHGGCSHVGGHVADAGGKCHSHSNTTSAVALLTRQRRSSRKVHWKNARIDYDRGYIEQAQHQLDAAEANYRKAIEWIRSNLNRTPRWAAFAGAQQQWQKLGMSWNRSYVATGQRRCPPDGRECCAHAGTGRC